MKRSAVGFIVLHKTYGLQMARRGPLGMLLSAGKFPALFTTRKKAYEGISDTHYLHFVKGKLSWAHRDNYSIRPVYSAERGPQ